MPETMWMTPKTQKMREEFGKGLDIVVLSYMPISGQSRVIFEVRDLLPEQAELLFKKTKRQMKETIASFGRS